MGMRALVLGSTVMCAIVLAIGGFQDALACSVVEDFDLFESADVVAEGRLTGWEFEEGVRFPPEFFDDIQSNSPERDVPFRVHMQVERLYKGHAPDLLDIVADSLDVYDHEPRYVWTGAYGACGAFTFDPTDTYVIVGLYERGGEYSTSLFGWFYVGYEPAGEMYELARARVAGTDDIRYPAALWLAAAAIPLAFLLVTAAIRPRGAGH